MRRTLRNLAISVCLLLVPACVATTIVVTTTGCPASATPQRKAFTTIDDVDAGAKAAMKGFNERYQQGLQTEEQRVQVLAYYAKYQKAALLAVAVARDLGQDANALTIATDAVLPLLDLIMSFRRV